MVDKSNIEEANVGYQAGETIIHMCHRWSRIFCVFIFTIPSFPPFIPWLHQRICNKNNTRSATSGGEPPYTLGAHGFTPFQARIVSTFSSCEVFVDHCLSSPFSTLERCWDFFFWQILIYMPECNRKIPNYHTLIQVDILTSHTSDFEKYRKN